MYHKSHYDTIQFFSFIKVRSTTISIFHYNTAFYIIRSAHSSYKRKGQRKYQHSLLMHIFRTDSDIVETKD